MIYFAAIKNLPKPHVVFKAAKFQTADEWYYQEEASKWDSHVVASFQENAWVDAQTHMYGLQAVLGLVSDVSCFRR